MLLFAAAPHRTGDVRLEPEGPWADHSSLRKSSSSSESVSAVKVVFSRVSRRAEGLLCPTGRLRARPGAGTDGSACPLAPERAASALASYLGSPGPSPPRTAFRALEGVPLAGRPPAWPGRSPPAPSAPQDCTQPGRGGGGGQAQEELSSRKALLPHNTSFGTVRAHLFPAQHSAWNGPGRRPYDSLHRLSAPGAGYQRAAKSSPQVSASPHRPERGSQASRGGSPSFGGATVQ